MQINAIEWHQGAQLFYGIASSVRGRRYRFGVYASGRVAWVNRESPGAPAGWTYWFHLRTPPHGAAKVSLFSGAARAPQVCESRISHCCRPGRPGRYNFKITALVRSSGAW